MLSRLLIGIAALCLALPLGQAAQGRCPQALECYHCYESFTTNLPLLGTLEDHDQGQRFVRCDKNKNKWNTWTCPPELPVCVHISGIVNGHVEVIRTCAVENYCSDYVPPSNVQMKTCRVCNTTLCNDYEKLSGPVFTFNVNINLNLEKNPIGD